MARPTAKPPKSAKTAINKSNGVRNSVKTAGVRNSNG